MLPERIFLTGFMGAGKSTAGKIIAKKTGYTFIDLDAAIEIVSGNSVEEFFKNQGEAAFRKLESSVLQQLAQKANIVVATGGGCGADAENMKFMNANGLCIYLHAQPGVLFHRLAPDKKHRPLISGMGDVQLMEFILDTLPRRENYYRLAEMTISSEKDAELVAEEIILRIGKVYRGVRI